MQSVPRVTMALITYYVGLYVHTIGHRNCNIQSWCVAMVNIWICKPCAMLCTWHIQIHFNFNSGMVTSQPPCGTLNHFALLQYSTLRATCRTERHCNWWHCLWDICAHLELHTDVDNLHGILYRQAGLLCSWEKENMALASVGLTALAVTVLPVSGTCNKLQALVTSLGLLVVAQSLHPWHVFSGMKRIN